MHLFKKKSSVIDLFIYKQRLYIGFEDLFFLEMLITQLKN